MVVQADTTEKEQYILTQEKFLRVYETPGVEITDHADAAQLKADGYLCYKCKGRIIALEMTQSLLDTHIPESKFVAPWGTDMLCEVGDFLGSPVQPGLAPAAPLPEMYRIEKSAFAQTYAPE
eukprot:TRINITY_DN11101_c0_g1_i6.p2 TRINITY_DN11101_c0_g1~~TRINITY_DN11101_c0_g1_i6.p2  ORF type:complete len:122 (+),score=23.93 TRINITY_DN11101_c0_g1_i6:383-748(+)